MTAAHLQFAETAYRAAYTRSEEARARRNTAIRMAVEAGWTHARIAEATGLSRARVGQLAPKTAPITENRTARTAAKRHNVRLNGYDHQLEGKLWAEQKLAERLARNQDL